MSGIGMNLFSIRMLRKILPTFNKRFQHIVLATNQRGITKGIMTIGDLENIHTRMLKGIEEKGGKIDRIYYCVDGEAFQSLPEAKPGNGLSGCKGFSGY